MKIVRGLGRGIERMTERTAVTMLAMVVAAVGCGSVGGKSDGGTGGGSGTGGSGAGGAIDGGNTDGGLHDTSIADSATPDEGGDGPSDGPAAPASCLAIKQQTPAATSGVYTIAPLGHPFSTYCEMTSDNGGWTAFYVGDNGQPPGALHFEDTAASCAASDTSCIRRLPGTVDITHEFAVKCGAAMVKFSLAALSLDYFQNGIQHGWQPLSNASTIDIVTVGKPDLVAMLWTGATGNRGWIISKAQNVTANTVFANGYDVNTSWNQCNGAADASSRVMLLYR
jgi:hypothetical protein